MRATTPHAYIEQSRQVREPGAGGAGVAAAEYTTVTGWKSAEGTFLENRTLASFDVQTLAECLHHCARHCPLCGSVNARVVDGTAGGMVNGWWTCELNVDTGNSSTLSERDGWEFYNVDVARCH